MPVPLHPEDVEDVWQHESVPTADVGSLQGKFSNITTLLAFGILLSCAAAGALALGLNEAGNNDTSQASLLETLAVILFVGGFAFFGMARYVSYTNKRAKDEAMYKVESRDYDFHPSSPLPEVIKVRCRYCGTLNDVSAKNCVACGATM